ncbi:hypothetical protein [Roseisolibacter sp. H3M3-2]|uniref:hypothetical protein n=1 Tax=Roseisolibacter sp. H3M3-2 TaxID=3031323 RepID=UPI0023DB3E0B|nr:hypothetical protein [Roseisolibacter sp. H3M3-2]MDF1502061.1 hypothetical protein [Roseisolibacter sp. H3M3-2]
MRPPPQIPWQVTGNHWLSLPCVHPADGSLHAVGVLHRGARAAVEFAGDADFLQGTGAPLLRPTLRVNGQLRELSEQGIAWERAVQWLPTFTCTVGTLVVRGTIFAPHGRDADLSGAVYTISVENRGAEAVDVDLAVEGTLGHRQLRVRTPRAFDDAHRATRVGDLVVLEGAALPGLVTFALGADGDAVVEAGAGERATFAVRRSLRIERGTTRQAAFYLAAGPERDGAEATVAAMRRRGWRELLTATREALRALEQVTGSEAVDRLINRNLLFAYFYGCGRALDDAHFYLMRTRVPWHAGGLTVRDWEALNWTLPAVQLADQGLARELLIRACELHGYAPGQGVHYLDGTLFEPGFSLEGAAAYAIATDRYLRDTGDDQLVEEPVVADTLYLSHDDIAARMDERMPLYSTEVSVSGAPVAHPFTLHGNAVVAQALDIFRKTLDEDTAKEVQDPSAVRATIERQFGTEVDGKATFAAAVDLKGNRALDDDPIGSALWLPLYEVADRSEATYKRTAKRLGAAPPRVLAQQCARLLGPDAALVLQWMRRAPLDNGFAAELVDEQGRAVANGGDAALSGLLAYMVWYAVHVLGVEG